MVNPAEDVALEAARLAITDWCISRGVGVVAIKHVPDGFEARVVSPGGSPLRIVGHTGEEVVAQLIASLRGDGHGHQR